MNFDYKTLAIAGALLFAHHKGYVKNKTANVALAAVGGVLLVKNLPVVSDFVNV